jgi:hypothetical protein
MNVIKIYISALLIMPFNSFASCYCSKPSEPSIPSGYYAESYQLESARSEIESYIDDINDYKRCLAQCIDEANSEAENVLDEWNSSVRQYNNR